MGLLCFGLSLRSRGRRITYLGADTPVEGLMEVASVVEPTRVVLSSVDGSVFARAEERLARVAAGYRVAIAGAGATPALAEKLGADLLAGDPVIEAVALA